MAKSGEKNVKEYLESKGLQAVKMPETSAKTVDFEVYYAGKPAFYLEEKTVKFTAGGWKDMYPVYNTIAKHIYEAIKQFKSVNPHREVPNVLAFTNRDEGRSIDDLFITLVGHVVTSRGKMRRIEIMKKIEKEDPVIDLFLWFDHHQMTGHIWDENIPQHEAKLAEILELE